MQFDFSASYPSRRASVMARAAVATSQMLATQAGAEILAEGGSAADAAVAAAVALTVVEPTGTGIGADAFALLNDGSEILGLNGSGRAPAAWRPERFSGATTMPLRGWDSVTVPGAVSLWVALSQRFGRLPFARLFEPAVRYAREGFHVTPRIATLWAANAAELGGQPGYAEAYMPGGRAPAPGEIFRLSAQADTLEMIARTGGEAFYRGELAEAMAAHAAANGGGLAMDDLAAHRCDWVRPMATRAHGATLHEIPPNGQGIAALAALAILAHCDRPNAGPDDPATLHLQIEAMKLALADLRVHVADPAAMRVAPETLFAQDYAMSRAAMLDPASAGDPGAGAPEGGGTVLVAAADAEGQMVSLVQSNYKGFGSGIVVPGTGISLQNRGFGFSLDPAHPNVVAPGKRPFQTIIPGFVNDAGGPAMAFGMMGGPMQAQGHLQLFERIRRHRQTPQTAIDAPRWRALGGRRVAMEANWPAETLDRLRALGHEIETSTADETDFGFGGAQIVHRIEGGYIAGSDGRKDGGAIGLSGAVRVSRD